MVRRFLAPHCSTPSHGPAQQPNWHEELAVRRINRRHPRRHGHCRHAVVPRRGGTVPHRPPSSSAAPCLSPAPHRALWTREMVAPTPHDRAAPPELAQAAPRPSPTRARSTRLHATHRAPLHPGTVATPTPTLRRARSPTGPPLLPVHREPSSAYKCRPPRARIRTPHSTPPRHSTPHCFTYTVHRQEGGNRGRRAAAALQFPPEPKVAVGHDSIVPLLPSPSLDRKSVV